MMSRIQDRNNWKTSSLHSFTHLAEEKAEPGHAKLLLDRAQDRLHQAEREYVDGVEVMAASRIAAGVHGDDT